MNTTTGHAAAPGRVGRFRSRQSGHPSGLIGRFFGRVMVKDTAASNDCAIELLALNGSSTVLDVGCGQGRTIAELVRGGHRAVGVDPSATMVAQARARNRRACARGDAEVLVGDGRLLPLTDGTVDHALTAHAVYFMPDPATTFAEVARVLRPGGRFVVACHVGDDPLPGWADPEVYRIPTADQLREMLHLAGFEHVDVVSHHEGAPWPTYWFVADLPQTDDRSVSDGVAGGSHTSE